MLFRKELCMAKKFLILVLCMILLCGCQHGKESNVLGYYTEEEARAILSQIAGVTVSPDCYLNLPKEVEHVSTFVKNYPEQDSLDDFYRSYRVMYEYLFPGVELDENNLFYYGANSNNQEGDDKVKTIGRNYDDFIAEEKEDVYYMFYSPYFYDGQKIESDVQNVFLELSSPVGTIMTNFNKGVLAEFVSDMRQMPNQYFLETYVSPNTFGTLDLQTGKFSGFEMTEYSPDSEVVCTMLDGKELSVRDSVKFFEDYINALPYPKRPNLDVQVVRASAVEIQEGKYCYAFECTVALDGIPFDYIPYGTVVYAPVNAGYEPSVRMGYMAVSDDVDAAYGFCRSIEISEQTENGQIVSLETAWRSCVDSLKESSGDGSWDLRSAELVYYAGDGRAAEKPYQGMEYTVAPNYKFVLYHAKEERYHMVYIDAVTGAFARCFTSADY